MYPQSEGGPRFDPNLPDTFDLDSYENLVLLCKSDHEFVDKNWIEWPVARLTELKSRHEEWVSIRLSRGENGWVADPTAPPLRLKLVTAELLWSVAAKCQAYRFSYSAGLTAQQKELVATFCDVVKDWLDIGESFEYQTQILEAESSIEEAMEPLIKNGLVVLAGRQGLLHLGGAGTAPLQWAQAEVWILTAEDFLQAAIAEAETTNP